jgi:integrase
MLAQPATQQAWLGGLAVATRPAYLSLVMDYTIWARRAHLYPLLATTVASFLASIPMPSGKAKTLLASLNRLFDLYGITPHLVHRTLTVPFAIPAVPQASKDTLPPFAWLADLVHRAASGHGTVVEVLIAMEYELGCRPGHLEILDVARLLTPSACAVVLPPFKFLKRDLTCHLSKVGRKVLHALALLVAASPPGTTVPAALGMRSTSTAVARYLRAAAAAWPPPTPTPKCLRKARACVLHHGLAKSLLEVGDFLGHRPGAVGAVRAYLPPLSSAQLADLSAHLRWLT